ncbi:MAG TPA: hypothetical protein DCP92_09980 [Nitrospiraceae bacterium]|jgi:hypothetical protein|nr:hypothetical protein [Nitrospiraceae bacterium]
MVIIKRLDDKLMRIITERPHFPGDNIKRRSLLTVVAIWVMQIMTIVYKGMSDTLLRIMIIVTIISGIVVSVSALYEWRHFFALRGQGLNHDRNYFFEESAGKYRNAAFYSALLLVVLELFGVGNIEDLHFILKADFHRLVGRNILLSISRAIVLVELLRIGIPMAARWSDRKHVILVIISSIILSIVTTLGLRPVAVMALFEGLFLPAPDSVET